MADSTPYNEKENRTPRETMPLSGEAIRLMNYIDDVAVTLRRVLATIPTLTAEERARVAEHLLQTKPSAEDLTQALTAKPTPIA
jgi:phosphoserine phosphatase